MTHDDLRVIRFTDTETEIEYVAFLPRKGRTGWAYKIGGRSRRAGSMFAKRTVLSYDPKTLSGLSDEEVLDTSIFGEDRDRLLLDEILEQST